MANRVISKILARNNKEGVFNIVIWWEKRRIVYNFVMIMVGIPATILFLVILQEYNPSSFEYPDEFVPLISIVLAGMVANILYTFGWITEIITKLILKDKWPDYGPKAWLCGLCFSILVCLLPSVLELLYVVLHPMF